MLTCSKGCSRSAGYPTFRGVPDRAREPHHEQINKVGALQRGPPRYFDLKQCPPRSRIGGGNVGCVFVQLLNLPREGVQQVRNHLRLRKYAIFTALSLSALSVTAPSGVAAAQNYKTDNSSSGLNLTVWCPSAEPPAVTKVIQAAAAATGVHVTLTLFPPPFETAVQAKYTAGIRPDLLLWDAGSAWHSALRADTTMQNLSGLPNIKKIPTTIEDDSCSLGGELVCAVFNYPNIIGLVYNTKILKQYGITPPTNIQTLLAACMVLKQKAPTIAPIYEAGGSGFTMQVMQDLMFIDYWKTHPQWFTLVNENKASYDNPVFVSGLTAWLGLWKAGCYNSNWSTATYEDQQQALIKGTAAMEAEQTNMIQSMVDSYGAAAVGSDVGFAPLSYKLGISGDGGGNVLDAPITGNAAKEQAARNMINWIDGAGYPQVIRLLNVPSIEAGVPSPAGVPEPLVQAAATLATSTAVDNLKLLASYGNTQPLLEEMVAGKLTPAQVCASMEKEFTLAAEQAGLKGF